MPDIAMSSRHALERFTEFRDALDGAIRTATIWDGEGRRLAGELGERLADIDCSSTAGGSVVGTSSSQFPAQQYWATAIANALGPEPMTIALAGALDGLAEHLHWYRREEPDRMSFMAGHANAVVVGPTGLINDPHLLIGVTLMAPATVYPDHHHPPEEGYIVLSTGQWRQAQGPWHTPGIGGWVYNPPDIVHAMRSGDEPLLAVWCLPL